MADPLSIAAGVIAILQATNKALEVYDNFEAALKNDPWGLSQTIEARPLVVYAQELRVLEETVSAAWSGEAGVQQRAFKRAICWTLNEKDVKTSLQRIEQYSRENIVVQWLSTKDLYE
ncbi:hypothetical protein EJ05DRAFT_486580 [Pseudovirgaria hyperparasitica]|uniref:Uncharacterized protein n=1 Tax=Pseudovirgaria hyperparasitica TaxID=470096 RepID=A0A6A6W4Q0_9PEZI|nr:uncharacterized protein EJ05DRAFT_486580 [Pseudovirgaria hyperparasitica]KAF2757535.1 hypothetical protein EJ05DRAFT_486580 [Pseudovirgaria hyperparasitica]